MHRLTTHYKTQIAETKLSENPTPKSQVGREDLSSLRNNEEVRTMHLVTLLASNQVTTNFQQDL